ncbi:hypothetical protein B0H19DRAFT_1156798 [Mycena capillaripes]|nr:hypothetical protein B0H19DRAFT_1156798 [Mycena capillaripes]
MGPELELTVTITYEGAKARITTVEEADPVIRQDLTSLGIPHPKRANVSVVYAGTVRFFWIAQQNSVIHKNLLDGIRPRHSISDHRELLKRLSIQNIVLRESPSHGQPSTSGPSNDSGTTWKPDAGLYAVPMSGTHQESSVDLDGMTSSYSNRAWDGVTSGSKASWDRNQPPIQRIKAEPVADAPIPPSTYRTRYDEDDEMQIDTPSSVSRRPLKRNRYKSIPDYNSPHGHAPHEPSEVQELRRELREVRRQLNADIVQERAIVENLRDLGVMEEGSDASEIDFVTKARIEQFEAELQAERARRRRLEDIVEDIRRECRAPFVVPSLLDAFVEISKLTNEAIALEEG